MPNKIIKFLVVVLFLVTIAAATETTWRHSGFEVAQYDINFASIYNITELRVLEWGWNASTPSVSDSNRAKMYYDNDQKRMMQSIGGGTYEAIITNTTVNFYSGNASNITIGVLPNASIPLSAANLSENNTFTGTGNTSFAGNVTAKQIGGVIYADQYATIQDAVNALDSTRTYKQTVKVVGTYTLNSQINLSNYTILDISDAKLNLSGNIPAIQNKNWGGVVIDHDIEIIGGHIDAGGQTTEPDHGIISLRSIYNISVTGVTIENGKGIAGIYLALAMKNNPTYGNSYVQKNIISNMSSTVADQYGAGIFITAGSNVFVSENILIRNKNGISADDNMRDVEIYNNQIYNSVRSGIQVDLHNSTISGNRIYNSSTLYGISNAGDNSIYTENWINGAGNSGILLSDADNSTVINNIIIDAATTVSSGIDLIGTNDTYVAGNVVYGLQTDYGVALTGGSTRNIIQNNKINGNQYAGIYDDGTGNLKTQNYDTAPYYFGNSATAPTAFGFGDTYQNSTSLDFTCGYTGTQWQNASGNTVVC